MHHSPGHQGNKQTNKPTKKQTHKKKKKKNYPSLPRLDGGDLFPGLSADLLACMQPEAPRKMVKGRQHWGLRLKVLKRKKN